jgi:hypothetical protein
LINLKIFYDSHSEKSFLNAMEVKQIAFGVSKALNMTAKEAVEKIRNNLLSEFTLRNNWTKKGITFAGCNKRDWPDMQIVIGSKDWYMADQETGGERRPKNRAFSIPYGIIKNPKRLIPLDRRAKAILKGYYQYTGGRRPGKASASASPKPFIVKTKSGGIGIFMRKGKRRYPIGSGMGGSFKPREALYWIRKKPVKLKSREWLLKNCLEAVNGFPESFRKSFMEAIASAK